MAEKKPIMKGKNTFAEEKEISATEFSKRYRVQKVIVKTTL